MKPADTATLGKAYSLGTQRELTQCRERIARLDASVAMLLERVSALERVQLSIPDPLNTGTV